MTGLVEHNTLTGDDLHDPKAHKDLHDPQDGADSLDTAAPSELAGVQAAATGTAHSYARSDHAHQIQASIADNHIVTINHATPVDNDYAKFTPTGLEGRSYAEVRTDLNIEDGADVTDATNVAAATAVMDADFAAADEVMVGTGAGTHGQVTLAASEFLAKKAAGAATNVSAAEARTILNVEDNADVTDSTNVAAAGAVMDSDIAATEGFMRKTGAGAYEAIKSNMSAAVAPTVNEDSGDGYAVASMWYDTTADKLYACLDATVAAAVWLELSTIAYTKTEVDTWRNSTTQTEMGYVCGVTSDIQTQLNPKAATELTIATGVVTATQDYHTIDTEADGATDDLVTINGGTEGMKLIIRPVHTDRIVVVKNGTGNIILGADRSLDNPADTLSLIYDGTNWLETGFAHNGA